MQIDKIYIENFGKHHQLEYTFTENLTQFLENNGFGKTTFAAFLKAMFYGLPTIRQNSKEFNDRKHYAPFNAGKFGGNISFTYNNKQYTIERFFDCKSDKKDSVKVYCNGKLATNFTTNIGKELFDLDRESFEKTTFITADLLDSTTTSDIQAKLGQFMDDTSAECNYFTAITELEKLKKYYKLNKGNGGKIYDLICRKQNCHTTLENIKDKSSQLEQLYLEYNQLKATLGKMADNFQASSQLACYTEYQNNIKNLQLKIENFKQQHPYTLPTQQQFQQLKTDVEQLLQLETKLQHTTFPAEKQAKLQHLQQKINPKPTVDTLQHIEQDIVQLIAKQAELSALQRTTTQTDNATPPSTQPIPTNTKKNSIKFLSIFPLFLLVAGIALIITTTFLTQKFKIFTILLGVLLFLVGITLTLFFGKPKKESYLPTRQLKETIAPIKVTNITDNNLQLTNIEREVSTLQQHLYLFFRDFGYADDNFLQNLNALKYNLQELETLQLDFQDSAAKTEALHKEYIALKEKINTLLKNFGIVTQQNLLNQLEELQQNIQYLQQLQMQLSVEQDKANDYFLRHNLQQFLKDSTTPETNTVNSVPVVENIEAMRQKCASIENSIADIEQQLTMQPYFENELEEIETELQICNEEYAVLTATIDYLQQAEENLKNKYLIPLQKHLNCYNLQQKLGVAIHLDCDLQLTFESNGERHSSMHLSMGQRTLCLFILRLALIDSLFSQNIEKPLLILDDPFVNLDEKHMQICQNILKTMASDRQIIYFCCHSSRKIV